jgi:hypothetical protein
MVPEASSGLAQQMAKIAFDDERFTTSVSGGENKQNEIERMEQAGCIGLHPFAGAIGFPRTMPW